MSQGRAGDGRQALEQALAHVSREVAPRTWNAVLFEIGMCLIDGPRPLEEAVAFARERLDAARAQELRGVEADMLHVLGAALGRRGDFDAAARRSRSRAGSATNWACGTWRSGPSATSVTSSWPPATRGRPSARCATAGTCWSRWA